MLEVGLKRVDSYLCIFTKLVWRLPVVNNLLFLAKLTRRHRHSEPLLLVHGILHFLSVHFLVDSALLLGWSVLRGLHWGHHLVFNVKILRGVKEALIADVGVGSRLHDLLWRLVFHAVASRLFAGRLERA